MREMWKPVVGWEGLYEVSDRGRVRSRDRWVADRWSATTGQRRLARGKVLKPGEDRNGYLHVGLRDAHRAKTAKVHHLVLIAFVGPAPPGAQCRHRDGKRANNRLRNLCWGTVIENHNDKRAHGTMAVGEAINRAKLTEADIVEIRRVSAQGAKRAAVAARFGVDAETVRHICFRKTWRHVGGSAVSPRPMQPKLTTAQVREIRRRMAAGEREQALSLEFGRPWKSINLIKRGVTYRDVR